MELVATQDGFVGEMARGFTFQALGEGAYRFPWHLEEPDPFLAALLLMGVLL